MSHNSWSFIGNNAILESSLKSISSNKKANTEIIEILVMRINSEAY